MTKSVYLNLEDDVSRVVTRIKKVRGDSLVLVCPKRCQLFSDSINLRLLKKQIDLLKKEVFILTMDEKGKIFAQEAGFKLKFLPKVKKSRGFSDIRIPKKEEAVLEDPHKSTAGSIIETVKEGITGIARTVAKPLARGQSQKQIKAKEEKEKLPRIEVKDNIFPDRVVEEGASKISKKHKSNQRLVTALAGFSLILILAVVFVLLPSAQVTVYPKTEPLTRDLEIGISSNVTKPELSRLVMPAKAVDETLSLSRKFTSQGKKEIGNKAKGRIKVYNFTGQPLNLKTETTVLTVGEKTYVLGSDVRLLQPTKYKNSKTKEVDQNSLSESYKIIALEGGESFNLPAGTRLEITNQVFGSRPKILYARTETAISGGTSRFLSVISKADITESKNQLTNLLFQELTQKLGKEGLVLVEGAYKIETVNFDTDNPALTESPSFNAKIEIKIQGLAINKETLQNLVTDRIKLTLSSNKTLVVDNWDQVTIKVKSIDYKNQLGTLLVHFEGKAVSDINLESLKPNLRGKNIDKVNEMLNSNSEIDRIDVNLAPSWQNSFPWFESKINMKLGNS